MSHLRFSFLGACAALLGDAPLVNFRSAKVQGLLIYLALTQHQAHGREELAALFWPDEPERVARHNLRQSLYRLRQLLDQPLSHRQSHLLITRSTVQFHPANTYTLDVTAFRAYLEAEQYEQAIALYRGELLPGFSCDSAPFDAWLREEREHLHRLALDALFALTAQHLARAEYQRAQRLAERQLALEPWREEAHRQLMQALALAGSRSAALAQYATCRRVLQEELGIEPASETITLATRIRDQALETQAPRQSSSSRLLTTPFVGRQREYETLVDTYRQATSGTLQVVALAGQAGIGKTRLAQQFLAWAASQGADVLVGRSFETSAGLSYQPLTQLLRERIERENAPDDLLADLWLSQLTRLLPELRDRYPDLPEPTQEEATARQHLYEAITRLGQALAARAPLVLFLDDWHWADAASLDVLQYATHRWAEEPAPILVVLTLRQNESPTVQRWLAQLKRTMSAVQIQLNALSQAETAHLVQMLLASEADADTADTAAGAVLPQFSQWLYGETGGQPLLLAETLKALSEDGRIQPNATGTAWHIRQAQLTEPGIRGRVLQGVRELIQDWLARMTPAARELLTAAAVLAQAASFDNLCRVAGLDEAQAVSALDELLHRQLLLEAEDAQTFVRDLTYSFSHQKVSEVVYAEAGTARRRLLHRRALATLQTVATPAADLAHHALHGGLPAKTISYSLLAGNEAMALFASHVAITHYETAWQIVEQKGWPEELSSADRQTLYTTLGRAYELVQSWDKAQAVYQAMLAYAQSIASAAMECLSLNHLSLIEYLIFHNVQGAVALLERALAVAEQHGDQRGIAETEWNRGMAAIENNELHLARQHVERALAIARNLEHLQLVARCINILAYLYLHQREWKKVETAAREASQLYTNVGNLVLAADTQRVLGTSLRYCGELQQSLAVLQETASFSYQIENLWGQVEADWRLASTWLDLGDYSQAIRLSRQSVRQAHKLGHHPLTMWAAIMWGTVQRTILDLAAARETLLPLLEQEQDDFRSDWLHEELCAVFALAGEWEQAHHYSTLVLASRRKHSILPTGLSTWHEIEALLRGGAGDLARTEVERLAGIVDDNKRYRLVLLRSQAVLAAWDGAAPQAIEHLEAALALAQEIGLPGEAWPILGELGSLYTEQGEQAQAAQACQEATAIIRRLAATIDEADLRAGFLAAGPVRAILER